MEMTRSLVLLILVCCLIRSGGAVTFSSLKDSLVVTASPTTGQVLKAGEDEITVTWSLNESLQSGIDSDYKQVKVELCYAPISQVDRKWRKTADDLSKDKTCQFKIATIPYTSSNNTFTWTITKEIPTATYFIRAYALDSTDQQIGYGQTTNPKKTSNLFEIKGISGRHASIDAAAACFSAFSIFSLAGFFVLEKRKAKAQ